ncbi:MULTISPECIES: GNAT family N-acetyltransferase [Bacillaceae]|jgi:predicted GNAT family acetyltransferase|uniref:GNAT family N-acetyltransferase n=1 Tax=Niallia hominis TaxID=3133173 RepID=A0ABV1EW59_9BACI|nr:MULTISPECIES: GNAT family N-acetyltransferase [Bacillaceae]MCM3363252.1 GNAT family N-acetyltransferase [Niallia sp. MER TA 168]REB73329.1 N-acetyltransferase [Cutibacterium acnes]
MKYRKATVDDINLLVEMRKIQLVDEGIKADKDIDNELKTFFQKKLAEGTLIQWVVEVEEQNEIIATGAIVIYDFPPSYTNKSGKKAYVTNMYTKNDYRGKGIATSLLTKLVDEAKNLNITKMWLGASKLGRPVYKKFGFKETDEWMELEL